MDANEIYKKYIAPEPPEPEPPEPDNSLEEATRYALKDDFKNALDQSVLSQLFTPSYLTKSTSWDSAYISMNSSPIEITSIEMTRDILKWPTDTVIAVKYKIGGEKYGITLDIYPYLQLSVEQKQELIRKEIVDRIAIQFKEDFVFKAVSEALIKIKLC